MVFKSIKKGLVAGLLTGIISLTGACGNYNTFKPGSIPTNKGEISAVVADVEKARESCRDINSENCDKQGYLQGLAKLAGYELNKKGIDISNTDFTYDNAVLDGYHGTEKEKESLGGLYVGNSDGSNVIWIDTGKDELVSPEKILPQIYHETGHKVHSEKYGSEGMIQPETASILFENYFSADSLNDSNIPYKPENLSLANQSYGKGNEYCDSGAEKCRFETGQYLNLKYIYKDKGDFNKTLEDLAKTKTPEDSMNEMKADALEGNKCGYVFGGVSTYNEMLQGNDTIKDLGKIYCGE